MGLKYGLVGLYTALSPPPYGLFAAPCVGEYCALAGLHPPLPALFSVGVKLGVATAAYPGLLPIMSPIRPYEGLMPGAGENR